MKNKKAILISIILIIVIAGLIIGYLYYKKNSTITNYKDRYDSVYKVTENMYLTDEKKKEINNLLQEVNKHLDSKDISDVAMDKLEQLEKIVATEEKVIKENLNGSYTEINKKDMSEFNDEQKKEYLRLKDEYLELVETKKYSDAKIKLEELSSYADNVIQEILKSKQPDVMDNAISISNFTYQFYNNNWKVKINADYKNETNYSFSKVIFTFQYLETELYGGGSCGTVDITVNDVKIGDTGKLNYDNSCQVTCPGEYDRLKFISAKAYK